MFQIDQNPLMLAAVNPSRRRRTMIELIRYGHD